MVVIIEWNNWPLMEDFGHFQLKNEFFFRKIHMRNIKMKTNGDETS